MSNIASKNVAATITCHHLLYNRYDMLVGGYIAILKSNILADLSPFYVLVINLLTFTLFISTTLLVIM
jgi:hypothetical protein